jgi:hypothetical protein
MSGNRFILLAALLLATGCGDGGPTLHYVAGTVTKGDKPLAGISVTFSPEKGPSSTGVTNAEGKFIVVSATGKRGAIAGKHKVTIQKFQTGGSGGGGTFDPVAMMKEREGQMKGGKKGAPVGGPNGVATDAVIPPEYGDALKTPLTFEVKEGSNDFDIPIP